MPSGIASIRTPKGFADAIKLLGRYIEEMSDEIIGEHPGQDLREIRIEASIDLGRNMQIEVNRHYVVDPGIDRKWF